MARPTLRVLGVAATLALTLSACSSDGESRRDPTSTTAGGGTAGQASPDPEVALLAEAKGTAVGFFEAVAAGSFDLAEPRASGAAAVTVAWADAVRAIDATAGTPWAVAAPTAPDARVQLGELSSGDGGAQVASGFLELGDEPGGLASTTTTTTAEDDDAPPLPDTTFVVDLTFEGEAGSLTVSDYRLDAVASPVSQLYVDNGSVEGVVVPDESDDSTTTEPPDDLAVALELSSRAVNGAVQFLVDAGDATVAEAGFLRGTGGTTSIPPASELGTRGQVFGDDPSEGDDTLVVFAGAFPGSEGTLRVVLEGDDGERATFDLAVPAWPDLTTAPLNAARDAAYGTTSPTTSSSTTTTEPDDTTTTADDTTTTSTEPDEPTTTTTDGGGETTTTEPDDPGGD